VIDYQFLTFASASPDCAITIAVTAPKSLSATEPGETRRRRIDLPAAGVIPGGVFRMNESNQF